MDEDYTVSVVADTSQFESSLSALEKQAEDFGNTLTKALKGAVVDGKGLNEVLRDIGLQLSSDALSAGLQPLSSMLNDLGGNIFSSLTSVTPFATGGVLGRSGQVVAQPSYFPMGASGVGVAGEAGAEAILPLSRTADGNLGVVAQQSGSNAPIIVNISTPDANSFARSENQVSAAVARAVNQGRRSL